MEVITVDELPERSLRRQVLAIGKFDGVHIGHRAILDAAMANTADADLSVMSFTPHPVLVLTGQSTYRQVLTPLAQKGRLLTQYGVKRLYLVQFTREFAATSAQSFVSLYLSRLNLSGIVVGSDFRFGQGGLATGATLQALSQPLGIPVTIVSPVEQNGMKVSSSQIRKHLEAGRVEAAEALLGHAYTVTGTVVQGDALGRTIGFRTANLAGFDEFVMPKPGVYAVSVEIDGQHGGHWFGVANAGYRPTVHGADFRFEIHLLGFHGDLYNKILHVSFLRRIRDEQKFGDISMLKDQIQRDVTLAKLMVGLDANA